MLRGDDHTLEAVPLDLDDTIHPCDVPGALDVGLHAVWIDREGRPGPPVSPPRPHRTLPSFVALVDALDA